MGLDDVRTILLLLHSPDVRVAGIVVTEGASDVDAAEKNVKHLLAHFNASHIPVVRGVTLNLPVPPWREHSNAMGWVHERIEMSPVSKSVTQPANLNELIQGLGADLQAFPGPPQRVYYLSLGPLSTLARTLKTHPQVTQHISRVYFSGTGPGLDPSWNRACDTMAFEAVLDAPWKFVAFGRPDPEETTLSADFIAELRKIDTPAADFIAALHRAPHIDRLIQLGHLKLWDDTIALFLNHPELAEISELPEHNEVYQLTDWDSEAAEFHYLTLLSRIEH
jgi:inosine-uridine nucleoside N-ribohydrolase